MQKLAATVAGLVSAATAFGVYHAMTPQTSSTGPAVVVRSTEGPSGPVTTWTPPASTVHPWLVGLVRRAEAGGAADVSELGSAEYDSLSSELADLACCILAVVRQLHDIDPSWRVDPATISAFLDDWCHVSVAGAIRALLSRLPGASIRALPALNQVLSLIRRTCDYQPRLLDATSQQFVAFTVSNRQRTTTATQAPPRDEKRVAAMHVAFDFVCKSLSRGLTAWVARALKASRANFFVTIAIESATSLCPAALNRMMPA